MTDRARATSLITALVAGVGLVAGLGLTGCGADEGRTALAVRSTAWNDRGDLVVAVECADDVTADVELGAGTEGLPLLTAWGEPRLGRCASRFVVALPPGTTRIDDAATGMVVDLPPRS